MRKKIKKKYEGKARLGVPLRKLRKSGQTLQVSLAQLETSDTAARLNYRRRTAGHCSVRLQPAANRLANLNLGLVTQDFGTARSHIDGGFGLAG